jgi:hypothetical protein
MNRMITSHAETHLMIGALATTGRDLSLSGQRVRAQVVGDACQVVLQHEPRVAGAATGQLPDLVQPVDQRVAVHPQFGGRADQVEQHSHHAIAVWRNTGQSSLTRSCPTSARTNLARGCSALDATSSCMRKSSMWTTASAPVRRAARCSAVDASWWSGASRGLGGVAGRSTPLPGGSDRWRRGRDAASAPVAVGRSCVGPARPGLRSSWCSRAGRGGCRRGLAVRSVGRSPWRQRPSGPGPGRHRPGLADGGSWRVGGRRALGDRLGQ